MTRILVLDGHPANGSFCSALAEEYSREAGTKGHEVRVRHLSKLDFNPDYGTSDFDQGPQLEPDLQAFWEDITWCEHIVIVHPLWWGGHPAKLKGLFDRVLLSGKAFKYVKGKTIPEKLLKGRSAEVLVTADTPGWIFKWIYGAGIRKQTEKQILAFCGFKPKGYHVFSPIHGSDDAERTKMLSRAGHLGRRAA
ncbi:putative NADPH-quinone reductase [Labrenzia sp. EL_208]|uniref:NAD(P)H-dependent oxidoreductase n=1 Tax=Roseibium album TaxID=311410 RepID=UPI000CF12F4F|nr:NAD(P)H-dependent oxidoreductase [Roseibium album]MBG6142869.1 putative NADPH-quinone reductase [Labrenzia sp. EL_142]MBG6158097.1 putative NADPH-quinone reductase [Labrenzia sp. EL_162]MBG6165001.1 putative NADPH-quinone reductase [Labrenzia sp. EL_195]MBG6172716.1 putative NADPH-quinone reductase [Labrenzia sp. EL_132]MBG6196891.1 putative NADPH-quinone reductase [Labrenzia sp. EL_159]MBG6202913.1 putative NADPH-quinone reductase [Labrenzia sp. EL_13]MBG6227065.1 putative NADPH-quinone 